MLLAGAPTARAQFVVPTTLPLKETGTAVWYFLGDKVVGLSATLKGGEYTGRFDAYSLSDAKFLWRLDAPLGEKGSDVYPRGTTGYFGHLRVVGQGPLSLVDVNTGTILWTVPCKAAKVPKKSGEKILRRLSVLYILPAGAERDSGDVIPDHLAIAGERFQGVSLADGKTLWETKDKPGLLCGAYGRLALFGKGSKLTAYSSENGAKEWEYDYKGNEAVYTVGDLLDRQQGVPEGMTDILVVGPGAVSRLDTATGKVVWKVKRGGMRWQGTALALLTLGKGKIAAYDWSTGSRLWETKAKVRPKSFAYDSGGYIVLIDAEKKVGDDLRPPYRVTVVNGKTGKIVWAKKDLGGKKIVNYSFAVPGQIRLVSKKEVVANLNVADGGAAAAPAGVENQRFVEYSRGSKTLICRDFVGNVAWTREDEISERASFTVKKDYVVWPTKRGIVEVISLSDGMLRWRSDFEESPRPFLNEAGTYLVVQGKEDVTIVKMVD